MGRANKKNLLITSLFALLTTGLPGLFFNTAKATSIYDDVYQTTNELILERNVGYCTSLGEVDITKNWLDIISDGANWNDPYSTAYDDLQEAIHNGGSYVVSNVRAANNYSSVTVFGSSSPITSLYWDPDFVSVSGSMDFTLSITLSNDINDCKVTVINDGPSWVISAKDTFDPPFVYRNFVAANVIQNLPSGYAGLPILDESAVDIDGDGLNGAEEDIEGTSHFEKDTDGDGLSDIIESGTYNPSYDEMFCKQTSPYTCADPDPLEKDLFIEIDWMNDGTNDYKPTSTQLAYATTGLSEDGYNVHFDMGEYGGGTVLSDYVEYLPLLYDADPVGFYDFKNGNVNEGISAHFDSVRQGVWRYLISGYGMTDENGDPSTISGGTYSGSDNIFVSTGLIASEDGEDIYQYSDPDYAVAGTIVHEVGHGLCMSDTQRYSYQSNNCIHAAVDTFASSEYDSVLNYNRQMFQLNLSNGGGGGSDHDDWGAISGGGIDDFSQWTPSEFFFEPGLSSEEVQAAIQNGTYGKLVKDGKVYDQLNRKMLDVDKNQVFDLDSKGKVTGISKNPDLWRTRLSS